MGTLFHSSHSSSPARATRLAGALLVIAAIAATAGAPLTSAQTTVINADKAVFGGTTFGDVLRVVGAGQVDSGVGTMNPWVLDSEGDARRDTVTTVSPTSVWNFGGDHVRVGNGSGSATLTLNGAGGSQKGLRFQNAGVTSGQFFVSDSFGLLDVPSSTTFNIGSYLGSTRATFATNGSLTTAGYVVAQGGSTVMSLTPLGSINVRIGGGFSPNGAGIVFEGGGSLNKLWSIDNTASVLKFARLESSGFAEHVPMLFDGNIRLAPSGKRMFPELPYGVDLGSLQNPFGSLYVGTIEANTINTIENTATVDNRWLVGDGNILDADLSPAATTMIVRYNNYATGEYVYLQKFAKTEFVKTTSGPALTNLLNGNASFENGTVTNWVGSAGDVVSNSTAKSYHGERSLLLTSNSNGTLDVAYGGFSVAVSTQYTACAFFRRSDAAIPAVGTVRVSARNSLFANMTIEAQGTDGWFRGCVTFTSGSGGDTNLHFNMNTADTVNYHIDGVQLETGNIVRPYSEYRSSYTIDRHAEDVPTGIGHQWYTGDGMFSTGATAGYGWLDCYALSGMKSASEQGPACVANVRTGTSFNQWEPHAAWGNLNGIYGYGGTIFGFAAGAASSGHITADPTNGVRLRYASINRMVLGATALTLNDPAGTARMSLSSTDLTFNDPTGAQHVRIDADSGGRILLGKSTAGAAQFDVSATQAKFCRVFISCPIVFDGATGSIAISGGITMSGGISMAGGITMGGNLDVGPNGAIMSGASGLNAGDGYWLDYNGGNPRFRVGLATGRRIEWANNSLKIISDGFTADENGIVLGSCGTAQACSNASIRFRNGSAGMNIWFDNTANRGRIDLATGTNSLYIGSTTGTSPGGPIFFGGSTSSVGVPGAWIRFHPAESFQNRSGISFEFSGTDFANEGWGAFKPFVNGVGDLGSPERKWGNIYFTEPTTNTAGVFPLVTLNGRIMAKNTGLHTNGAGTLMTCGAGQAIKSITVQFGIVTAANCGTP